MLLPPVPRPPPRQRWRQDTTTMGPVLQSSFGTKLPHEIQRYRSYTEHRHFGLAVFQQNKLASRSVPRYFHRQLEQSTAFARLSTCTSYTRPCCPRATKAKTCDICPCSPCELVTWSNCAVPAVHSSKVTAEVTFSRADCTRIPPPLPAPSRTVLLLL